MRTSMGEAKFQTARRIERFFRSPYAAPNGLQATDDGLWIVDQFTDRVALVEIGEPHEYGATKILNDIPSESSNTSGLTFDGEALWLAANGPGGGWRTPRPYDAPSGDILRVDPETGETLDRYPMPGGGATHGIDYDRFEEGMIWVTTLRLQTLSLVRIEDWSVQRSIPVARDGAHGIARVEDGIWVVDRPDRVIVKLDVEDGRELDLIDIPGPPGPTEVDYGISAPEPHGLTVHGKDLLYCDARSGWVVRVNL